MRIPPARLARDLATWRSGRGPLYGRLAAALQDLIERGLLPAGVQLPAERVLAAELGVSRNTAKAALRLLHDAGWVEVRRGAAPVVGAPLRRLGEEVRAQPDRLSAIHGAVSGDVIDLRIAAPDALPLVADAVRRPADVVPDAAALTAGTGIEPAGADVLREAIAARLRAGGSDARADEIVVCNGAQGALSLLAASLLGPRRSALVEDATFPGILDTIRQSGARVHAMRVGPHGLDVDHAVEQLAQHAPDLVYLTSFQNPTGTRLDDVDAARLVAAAGGATIVEDRAFADLALDEPSPRPLAARCPGARTIAIGSLSKVYWGGLRIGWIHAAPALATFLRERRAAADLGSPRPLQIVAATLLARHHATILDERLGALRRSRAALEESLRDADLGWEWTRPAGGPNLWVRLPIPDARAFARHAAARDVPVVAGPTFATAARTHDPFVRLPFYRDPETLRRAVDRLAAAWADTLRSSRGGVWRATDDVGRPRHRSDAACAPARQADGAGRPRPRRRKERP